MIYKERLASVRKQMEDRGIAAYIIPSSDPHISEYLPERFQCIAWTSGFTGSAGTLVITKDFAGLWTDARYFVQGQEELEGTGFELVKLQTQGQAEYVSWLANKLSKGDCVAFDGSLAAVSLAQSVQDGLHPLGVKVDGHVDLLDAIWQDRPTLPQQPAYLIGEEMTGKSAAEKIEEIRHVMREKKTQAHMVSSLDDLAWILNIRGSDVNCNPVVLGFLLITLDSCSLFIDRDKLSAGDIRSLEQSAVKVYAYDQAFKIVGELTAQRILIDPKRTCFAVYDAIAKSVDILEDMNPSTWLKAIKNETEIRHMRNAMVKDGIALTKFFKWLEQEVGVKDLSELSITQKLQELRSEQEGFVDISFATIAGYRAHGALPHYKASESSNARLRPEGLLLVDSGGQYVDGTTDITRVVSLGNATKEEREDYTIVLKGIIEGSLATFPKGTRGYQIDAITRRPIWEAFRDYGHGTGHGIGFFLNVHEGPHVFNKAAIDVPVVDGMISSIEPGLYREGEYGIRIENLVLSKIVKSNPFGDFMHFETLTACYIATDLVDKALLGQSHVDWLNNYNAWVFEELSPGLDESHVAWLKQKTKPI